MTFKIIAAVQAPLIAALVEVPAGQLVSFSGVRAVVRNPPAPGESTLSPTPPPKPKIPAQEVRDIAELRMVFPPKVEETAKDVFYASGFALDHPAYGHGNLDMFGFCRSAPAMERAAAREPENQPRP